MNLQMNQIVDQSSLAAREAGRVEGEVTAYWVAYYFSQQDPRRIYRRVFNSYDRVYVNIGAQVFIRAILEEQRKGSRPVVRSRPDTITPLAWPSHHPRIILVIP